LLLEPSPYSEMNRLHWARPSVVVRSRAPAKAQDKNFMVAAFGFAGER